MMMMISRSASWCNFCNHNEIALLSFHFSPRVLSCACLSHSMNRLADLDISSRLKFTLKLMFIKDVQHFHVVSQSTTPTRIKLHWRAMKMKFSADYLDWLLAPLDGKLLFSPRGPHWQFEWDFHICRRRLFFISNRFRARAKTVPRFNLISSLCAHETMTKSLARIDILSSLINVYDGTKAIRVMRIKKKTSPTLDIIVDQSEIN